ncbi:MAG: hypothetical protein J7521_05210 [Caulobacter sp.]|nr:hypothetical protein [Caulobacter sp.]
MRLAALFALLLLSTAPATSQAAPAPAERIEIPIYQTRFSNGVIRYWIRVGIDGAAPVEVMLDTGSVGMHLLPGAQPHAAPHGRPVRASYGSGVELIGEAAPTELTLDPRIKVTAEVDWTREARCIEERPECPARDVPIADYRIGGGPRRGFQAILGIGTRRGAADNPLARTATGAWIVVLPAPDDTGPGKLIVNATPADRERFAVQVRLQRQAAQGDYWWDNTIPVCLSRDDQPPLCGPAMLDTGAPNLRFTSDKEPDQAAWPDGARVTLAYGPADHPALRQTFVVGKGPGARVEFGRKMRAATWAGLNAGALPFQGLAVYYDVKQGVIGLTPRETFAVP